MNVDQWERSGSTGATYHHVLSHLKRTDVNVHHGLRGKSEGGDYNIKGEYREWQGGGDMRNIILGPGREKGKVETSKEETEEWEPVTDKATKLHAKMK